MHAATDYKVMFDVGPGENSGWPVNVSNLIIWTGDGLASWAAKHQNKEKKAKKKGGNPRSISYLCRDHSTTQRKRGPTRTVYHHSRPAIIWSLSPPQLTFFGSSADEGFGGFVPCL
jgi:hypothetical protein